MNTFLIATVGFVVFFIFVIIAVLRLDKKLREDNLQISAIAKNNAPYTAIIALKEVNDKYQIMIDGRLLSSFLMDRDELRSGFSAPVRLTNTINQLKVMELADKFDIWFPCLAPPDDLSEDTVYAYVEEKDGNIHWSKFAYDAGRGSAVNAPPVIFDKGSYNLFIQRFVRVAEVVVDKY